MTARKDSADGARMQKKETTTTTPIATAHGGRSDCGKPGGRLWLLKWLLVVTLPALLFLPVLPGLGAV